MQKAIRSSLQEAGKKHGSDKEAAAIVGKVRLISVFYMYPVAGHRHYIDV